MEEEKTRSEQSRVQIFFLIVLSLLSSCGKKSRDDFLHHLAGHVGQAVAATVVQVRQLLVFHAEQVQQRGVEVVGATLSTAALNPTSSVSP